MDTYLVRLWRPAPEDAETDLRGVVRHVGTGQERVFASSRDLLAFLRRGAAEATGAGAPGGSAVRADSD
jgi:hypothetical protein